MLGELQNQQKFCVMKTLSVLVCVYLHMLTCVVVFHVVVCVVQDCLRVCVYCSYLLVWSTEHGGSW